MLINLCSCGRSIEEFVEAFKAKNLPLHVLINNAGLQAPYDDRTEEGFEVRLEAVFGHLQHFLAPLHRQPTAVCTVPCPVCFGKAGSVASTLLTMGTVGPSRTWTESR